MEGTHPSPPEESRLASQCDRVGVPAGIAPWLAVVTFLAGGMILPACGLEDPSGVGSGISGDATLEVRPLPPTAPVSSGRHELGFSGLRDAYLYVPSGLDAEAAVPLLVLLHGAGGDADNWEGGFALADSVGVAFLAIDSRARSWDVINIGAFGPDVAFLDVALGAAFDRIRVDPDRIGIAGFSDGASYALSVGLTNGLLFSHVVAWSPGFSAPSQEVGRPLVFVSHGTQDGILSVRTTRDVIVPALRDSGYTVRYEEFVGAHEIPSDIARAAFAWFLEDSR